MKDNILSEVFHINLNGINPKIKKQKIKLRTLGEIVNHSETLVPFFSIGESHLKEYILDAEVNIPNYNVIRADRPSTRRKGGVAIYYHHSFSLEEIETFSNSYCELAMSYNKLNNIIIVAAYRPPETPVEKFKECLEMIKKYKEKHETATTLIMGDINLKYIDWDREIIRTPENIKQNANHNERTSSEMLLDFVNEELLVQVVSENTRKGKSLLDIVLTSDEDIIYNVKVEKTNLDTDHDMVKCDILLRNNVTTESEIKQNSEKKLLDHLNFHKAKWDPIRCELSKINWEQTLGTDLSVAEMYGKLEEIIYKSSENHTPLRTVREQKQKIPRNRLVLIRKRKKINAQINYLKYVHPSNSSKKIEKLNKRKSEIEQEIKNLISDELACKEIDAINKMKSNPKFFYQYVKKNLKSESKIGPMQDAEGTLHTDAKVKADLLQKQYCKAFSDPSKANISDLNRMCHETISDIEITTKDVTDAIKEIPKHASPGPDKLPAIVLKECAEQLSSAIAKIWRKSLDTGEIPDILKLQTIIPLYKKGNKTLPENFRPVSLTSHLTKLFERILRRNLIKHIESNNLLSENQHAFRVGRCCLSQLLHHIEYVLETLEDKCNIDVIYLDFAKAFDKVDHKILLNKVRQFGIDGKIYNWIENFLSNRYQQVIVDGVLSSKEKVISGVPQGTVLGPLLFLIYINDLEAELKKSILRIFADDSKVVKKIINQDDHEELQGELNIAMKWAESNNMELNKKKFQLMQYGKDEQLKIPYETGLEQLKSENDIKDLGVYLSCNLQWEKQIVEAIKTARKFLGWILRTFKSRNPEVMLFLYKSYVLPRLEYGSLLWSPYQQKNIVKIEAIQRKITSLIDELKCYNYHQRLRKLKLFSLQRRRERFAAIYMYKLSAGLVPNNIQLQFYTTRRGELKCHAPRLNAQNSHHSTLRHNYFTSSGPSIFNLLPSNIKKSESLEGFKRMLDKFLWSVPDLPPSPGYQVLNRNTLLEWMTGSYNLAETINQLAVQEGDVDALQLEKGAEVDDPYSS